MSSERAAEHFERLQAMSTDKGETWDHSDNDIAAINWAVSELSRLQQENERLKLDIATIQAPSFACGLIYGLEKPFVGGCGKPVLQHESYRCSDCTASFHRDCIREHFEMDEAIKNLRAPECWRKDCADIRGELKALREQVWKLYPYIHDAGMSGESEFEKAWLGVERALGPGPEGGK